MRTAWELQYKYLLDRFSTHRGIYVLTRRTIFEFDGGGVTTIGGKMPDKKEWSTPEVERFGSFAEATQIGDPKGKCPGTGDEPHIDLDPKGLGAACS